MGDGFFARLVRALAGIPAAVSVYAAVGLSTGALLAAFSGPLGKETSTCFSLGFFIPLGFLYAIDSSGWGMERTLRRLKRWKNANLIDQADYDRLRKDALGWYSRKRFG